MLKNPQGINLLKPKHKSLVDRFVDWALTVGRLLVILTEIVALSAFVYRFSLDRQLIDLHSKIKQEQAVITFLKEGEDSYRNLQDRLALAKTSSSQGKDKVKIFNDVLSLIPSGLSFTSFSVSEDRIKIDADVASVSSLSSFIESLKEYDRIETISLDKIENRPSQGVIRVSITAVFESKGENANKN